MTELATEKIKDFKTTIAPLVEQHAQLYDVNLSRATAKPTRGPLTEVEAKQLVENWKKLSMEMGKQAVLSLIPGYNVYQDVRGMMESWNDKQWLQFGFNLAALPLDTLYVGKVITVPARAVYRASLRTFFKAEIVKFSEKDAAILTKEISKQLGETAGVSENVMKQANFAALVRKGQALIREPTSQGIKKIAADMTERYAKLEGKKIVLAHFDINNFGARNVKATLSKGICNEELKAYDEAVLELAKKYTNKVTTFGIEEKFIFFENATAKEIDEYLKDFNKLFAQKCKQHIKYRIDVPPEAKVGITAVSSNVPLAKTEATIKKSLLDAIRAADLSKRLGTNHLVWSENLEKMISLEGKELENAISKISTTEKLTKKQVQGLREFVQEEKGRKSIWEYVRKSVEPELEKMQPGDGVTFCAHDSTIFGPQGSYAYLEAMLKKSDATVVVVSGSIPKLGRTMKAMNHTFEHYFGGNIWIKTKINNTKKALMRIGYKESKLQPYVFEKEGRKAVIGMPGAQEGGVGDLAIEFEKVSKEELVKFKEISTSLGQKSLQPEYGLDYITTMVCTQGKKGEAPEQVFKKLSNKIRDVKEQSPGNFVFIK